MNNIVRKATIYDLDSMMDCIIDAKAFIKQTGSTQWNGLDGYPGRNNLRSDIEANASYVCICNGKIAGVCAFLGKEENYETIYDGDWLTHSDNYVTIHRIAVKDEFRGQGIAKKIFEYAEVYAKRLKASSIRVDTHELNEVMQGLVKQMGYTYCGYALYKGKEDPKRLAFEKLL